MEAFSNQTTQILSNYTFCTLKKIVKNIDNSATKKQDMIRSIIFYLSNPKNEANFSFMFPKELLNDLAKILPDRNLKCICEKTNKNNLILCRACNKKQHISCMGSLSMLKFYECTACMISKMNPADEVLDFLVFPYMIGQQTIRKSFNYTENLKNEVFSSKSGIEIQFRCIKLQRPGYCMSWPNKADLYINNVSVRKFKPSSSSSLSKRKDTALDLSTIFKIGVNEIWMIKDLDNEIYALAVVKVHKLTNEEILKKMSAISMLKDKSIEFIKAKFSDDNEIKSCSIRLNLKCPYTLKTITIPARGKDCSHLSCFDLITFIDIQKYENYSWKCPICKGLAYEVYVDKYFEEILNNCRKITMLEGIQLKEDGSYDEIYLEEEDNSLKRKLSDNENLNKELKKESEYVLIKDSKPSRLNAIIIDD
ncbi:hypothetical protein SteCoe_2009 [Stentor coeruleus]|uniref:SP-RING-type domain-containing protein n=1 Tax=Stentor coeruleus TaxID=5963 RepID=A0A1R2D0A1_9CILI|nr:hypothetical protein SteCoe_2009 [Stentor coeruleus]